VVFDDVWILEKALTLVGDARKRKGEEGKKKGGLILSFLTSPSPSTRRKEKGKGRRGGLEILRQLSGPGKGEKKGREEGAPWPTICRLCEDVGNRRRRREKKGKDATRRTARCGSRS